MRLVREQRQVSRPGHPSVYLEPTRPELDVEKLGSVVVADRAEVATRVVAKGAAFYVEVDPLEPRLVVATS
jgi:hypothetical protein